MDGLSPSGSPSEHKLRSKVLKHKIYVSYIEKSKMLTVCLATSAQNLDVPLTSICLGLQSYIIHD